MKKGIAVILVFAMMFVMGACGNMQGQQNMADVLNLQDYAQDAEKETPVQENQQVQNQNYFYNDTNYLYDLNLVSVKPKHMYWEDGMLIAECFVINGLDTTVYDVNVEALQFANDAGDFAGASFGVLQGTAIAPYSYIVWTFTFPADCVYKNNADLTSGVNTVYRTSYRY